MESMREYNGKQILAFLRGKDYAHAGEEEAISLVMNRFDKKKEQTILDIGCGLGGTADFVQHNGWGQVTGFDIESASIDYAKKTYPNIDFRVSDVTKIAKLFHNHFDILYAFNSLYAFSDQIKALTSLNATAKSNAHLAIFDYLDIDGYKNTASLSPFVPIKLITIGEILKKSGWNLLETVVINEKYKEWYSNLVSEIADKKEYMIKNFGLNWYESAYCRYTNLLNAITKKKLGGVIVYAIKSNSL